jgi:hypothetical protein
MIAMMGRKRRSASGIRGRRPDERSIADAGEHIADEVNARVVEELDGPPAPSGFELAPRISDEPVHRRWPG